MLNATTARKTVAGVAALAAAALGGSVIADAATKSSTNSSSVAAQQQGGPPPPGGRMGGPPGRHVGSNGEREKALSGDVAAKVKAAAEKKLPGGTVERVETDVDHGSPYEAHVRKADGTQVEVLVNEDFEVTDVVAMRHP